MWVLRTPSGRLSLQVRRRTVWVSLALLLASAAIGFWTLVTGSYTAPVGDVLTVLTGGDGPRGLTQTVVNIRLPRLVGAAFVGAALGVSGALFQSVSRNPLGSPDIIGFTSGSATGAIAAILILHGSSAEIAAGAFAGGVLTAVVVYALTARHGLSGFRLILTGIGVSALLKGVDSYLITRADLTDAETAQRWLSGSLNATQWAALAAPGLMLVVLVVVAVALGPRLTVLELGDETAQARGVPVRSTRVAALFVGVALVAAATAVAGPVVFVALAAPHIARRLTRAPGPVPVPSALTGILLVVASDLAVQRVVAPLQLPVGVGTAVIGGGYLMWLLITQVRRRSP
ncbi:FecCD family ABC transporter permease [Actinoallomurus acaciae]|uniref:FecCD family ABC transporter permease n=1 Tax=Actinoallomurus acaciae TaxID=502577 RepID=A0ABV5YDC9_9ACTN